MILRFFHTGGVVLAENNTTILVTRPYLPPRAEYEAYLNRIWEENYLTNFGPLHQEFTEKLRLFLGGDPVSLVSNGHLGLDIALKALNIQGEVITTPFSFASTTHALIQNNITPVFCDIRQDDLNMDAHAVVPLITDRTTAILPVHVYGRPCDVRHIEKIAAQYNLKVIYDAAHAFGVEYEGKSISAYGDVSMFSLHATKLFHSIEGGVLICHDTALEERINAMRNFGYDSKGVSIVGINAKMNEFQAAMGLCLLPKLPTLIEERENITLLYREKLSDVPGLHFLNPASDAQTTYNYAYLPVLIEEDVFGLSRDLVYTRLAEKHIITRKYFSPLISDFLCYLGRFDSSRTPVAKKAAEQVLCLPIYNGLTMDDIASVCAAICGLTH
jgi:dTDP-4-amino-4,6-dideoxygalactose transaminase